MLRKAFDKLKEGLNKTRKKILGRLSEVIRGYTIIDDELLDEIEEVLVTADIGIGATMKIVERLRERIKEEKIKDPDKIIPMLHDELTELLGHEHSELSVEGHQPFVIMIVGVNGVGKTTTIGKLAARFKDEGKSVLLVAGDTFRAAAIDQLKIWADRVGVEIIYSQPGGDPAAVVFDAMESSMARGYDVVIVDTAGRLHTKINLMKELEKINKIIKRKVPEAPHETLLVLDATTGQNAITQAKIFSNSLDISGLVLAKLDGTAKGGVVVAIKQELNIPVKLIGVGESVDDLQEFDARDFVEALFS
jgi:fused signal recognition particle receptor